MNDIEARKTSTMLRAGCSTCFCINDNNMELVLFERMTHQEHAVHAEDRWRKVVCSFADITERE